MRYFCYICKKSVSSELPNDSIIRAILVCPECIELGKIIFPGTMYEEADKKFHEHLDVCKQCREHPFALCSVGMTLLRNTVNATDRP